MPDLVITPSGVQAGTGAQTQNLTSANNLNAGDVLYKNSASPALWDKATANGSAIQSGTLGLAIALGSTPGPSQPFVGLISGAWNPGNGGSLSNGQIYVVSPQPGKICPVGDLLAGQYPSILGGGLNSNTINSPSRGFFPVGVPKG